MDENLENYSKNLNLYRIYTNQLEDLRVQKRNTKAGVFTIIAWLAYLVIGILLCVYFNGIIGFLWFYPGIFFMASISEEYLVKYDNKSLLNSIDDQTSKLNKFVDDTRNKLHSFEKPVINKYEADLEKFFKDNLYKKRSGSEQFEESLTEFKEMIDELSDLNKKFVTVHVPLYNYQNYLYKRTTNQNSNKLVRTESKKVSAIKELKKAISKAQPKNTVVTAPQNIRVARKIDNWDDINKQRRKTGYEGEEIAVAIEREYLKSVGKYELADQVENVAESQGDGLGYDILSFFADGKRKYIEVKATKTAIGSPYYLSRNELSFLQEHKDDYFLYRIYVPNQESEAPIFESLTSNDIINKYEILPVNYMVKTKPNFTIKNNLS